MAALGAIPVFWIVESDGLADDDDDDYDYEDDNDHDANGNVDVDVEEQNHKGYGGHGAAAAETPASNNDHGEHRQPSAWGADSSR